MVLGIARVVCAAALGGLVVTVAGGGEAFWLAVPVALLVATRARGAAESAAIALVTPLCAALPALADSALGPAPPLPLALVVTSACVGVQHGMRSRLSADHAALRASAMSDHLTGLANRRAFAERCDYEVRRHARLGHRFAVVALDLDGFKQLNDRFGHDAGDELLRDVAGALLEAVRDQDTVARLGGDEFCVLAPETGRGGGERLAARLNRSIGRATAGLTTVSASSGVAVYPDDGRSPGEVLRAADAEQIAAKRTRARRAAA
jgi:diguanylate cyclase (GGDEF)-like protein